MWGLCLCVCAWWCLRTLAAWQGTKGCGVLQEVTGAGRMTALQDAFGKNSRM